MHHALPATSVMSCQLRDYTAALQKAATRRLKFGCSGSVTRCRAPAALLYDSLWRSSEQLPARDALLHDHPRDRDHRKAAVVQLLRLHLLELHRVLGLQAKRIEAEVAGLVVRLDLPGVVAGVLEAEDGEELGQGD